MAHFAKIENGIVTQVIVVANELCNGGDFPDSETAGQAFIQSLGINGVWKQTSYNTQYQYEYEYEYDSEGNPSVVSATIVGSIHTAGGTPFRGKYAGIGDTYDAEADQFIAPPVEV